MKSLAVLLLLYNARFGLGNASMNTVLQNYTSAIVPKALYDSPVHTNGCESED